MTLHEQRSKTRELEFRLFGRTVGELDHLLNKRKPLRCVWSVIREEFGDESLTLRDAAHSCGISPDHLNDLLKVNVGLTFHQLLSRYRILKSCELMGKREDYTLLDVALETGFANQDSMQRQFRRVTGMTPRQFRERFCR